MLLPLQGAPLLCMGKPRALPWARCFWAFSPRQLMRQLMALAFPSAADFQFCVRQHWFKKTCIILNILAYRPCKFHHTITIKSRKLCCNNSFPSSISYTQIYRGENIIIQTQKTGPAGIVFGGRNNSCINPFRQKSKILKPLKPK